MPSTIHAILTKEKENEVMEKALNEYRKIIINQFESKYKDNTFNNDTAFIEYSNQPSYVVRPNPRHYKTKITVNEDNKVRLSRSPANSELEYSIVESISEETKNKLKELVNSYTKEEIEKKRGDERLRAEQESDKKLFFGSSDANYVHLKIKQNDTWFDMGGYACEDDELGPIIPELDKIITKEIRDDFEEIILIKESQNQTEKNN